MQDTLRKKEKEDILRYDKKIIKHVVLLIMYLRGIWWKRSLYRKSNQTKQRNGGNCELQRSSFYHLQMLTRNVYTSHNKTGLTQQWGIKWECTSCLLEHAEDVSYKGSWCIHQTRNIATCNTKSFSLLFYMTEAFDMCNRHPYLCAFTYFSACIPVADEVAVSRTRITQSIRILMVQDKSTDEECKRLTEKLESNQMRLTISP